MTSKVMTQPNVSAREQGAKTRPSALAGISRLIQREVRASFRTRTGWVVISLALLITGILFNSKAIGTTARLSTEVLEDFFYYTSGVVLFLAYLVSLRSIVDEQRAGTLPLLQSSSLTEGEIIFAKYIAAMLMVLVFLVFSAYLPALVFVRGKVSLLHIGVGYLGLFFYASAIVSIGIWASAFSRGWLVAGAISAGVLTVLHTFWMLSKLIEGRLGEIIAWLALHDRHFLAFRQGVLSLQHVAFYLVVTCVFLVLSRNALEGRRWAP